MQNLYSLAARDHDPVLDHTVAAGIAFLPFFPLAIGDLARDGSPAATVATDLDVTPSQVALAWLPHRAPNVIPIPGTTSLTHLEENLGARDVTLSEARFQRITDSSHAAVANE